MMRIAHLVTVTGVLWGSLGAFLASEAPQPAEVSPGTGPHDQVQLVSLGGTGFSAGMKGALLPGGPVLAGRTELLVDCYDVTRAGDLALVAFFEHVDKFGGFRVVDVRDPHAPVAVGSFDTVDMGQALAWDGTTAWVATLNPYTYVIALRAVDVNQESTPREVGIYYHPTGSPQGLVLEGRYGYLAAGGEGVLIFDLSDRADPKLIAQIPSAGFSYGVVVRDGILYVADGEAGLRLYDVSVPSTPSGYGAAPTAGLAYDVVLKANVAWISDPLGGLFGFDVSDATHPLQVAQLQTPGSPAGMWLEGQRLFVADGPAGLTIVDVSVPVRPRVVGNAIPASGAQATAVQVAQGFAYVSDFFQGLLVFDVSRPASPQAVDRVFPITGGARAALRRDDTLFVAAGEAGLQLFDVNDPAAIALVGSLDTDGVAEGMVLDGDRLLLADGLSGLVVFDVSDRTAPRRLGGFDTTGNALGVAVSGRVAYVADDARGLRLFDLGDPTSPRPLGFYDSPGRAFSVAVANGFAFVADYLRGVQVVDVSNALRPTLVANIDTPGRAVGVTLSGSRLLVADDFGGLQLYDVTTPRTPQPLGGLALEGSVLQVLVDGEIAWLARGAAGIAQVDLSNPTAPFLFASYDTPGSARTVLPIADGRALVADDARGLVLLRSNPRPPAIVVRSGQAASWELPAGLAPGPYHIRLASESGEGTLDNGYTVCEPRAVTIALRPVDPPRPGQVVLPWPWTAQLAEPESQRVPTRGVRLLLPSFESPPNVTYRGGVEDPEIAIESRSGRSTVVVAASTAPAAEALWSELTLRGGIELGSGEQPGTWGRVAIGYVPPAHPAPWPAGKRLDPWDGATSYRWRLSGGVLVAAELGGSAADLLFEGYAGDDLGCEARATASFRAAAGELLEGAAPARPPGRGGRAHRNEVQQRR